MDIINWAALSRLKSSGAVGSKKKTYCPIHLFSR